jgi:hypothetical protein
MHTIACRVDRLNFEIEERRQMNFHRRLAARGYYVFLAHRSIFIIYPAPLRTVLALLTHTAPHQYIHFVQTDSP